MDNEYSQFENLIQDVTSIDTARMTLRWALERLNTLGKTNRELDEKLIAALESQKSSDRRMKEMEEMVASRMKLLNDQEAFYKKLEQTVNLLAEGKVDIVQIAKKEVDLDRVRQEVSDQYKSQLEAMERANRDMVARWTQRLLEAESFNPETLSEVLKKYDEYRREIDRQYQERLLQLEKGVHEREGRLGDRERELESSYQSKLKEIEDLRVELRSKVEARTKDLEAAHDALRMQAQRELEDKRARLVAEAETLKEALHKDFQTQADVWQKEQTARVEDLQRVWDAERRQLSAGQRDFSARLKAAARRIEELEQILSTSDAKHQEDMLRHIAESEYAFQQKIKEFERVQAEARAALEERSLQLEKEHAARREDIEASYQERIRIREEELKREKSAIEAERRALIEELSRTESRVQQAQQEVVKMREAMARQREMLDGQANERLAAQDKLAQEQIQALQLRHAEQTRQLESLWLAEKQRLLKDLASRDSNLAKAYADLELVREQLTKDFEAQLKARDEANAERRKVLESNWQAERIWLMREVEDRDVALAKLRDELRKSQETFTNSAIDAQAALETLRHKLNQEMTQLLRERDEQEAARMRVIDAKWDRTLKLHQEELGKAESRFDAERRLLDDRRNFDRKAYQEALDQAQLRAQQDQKSHEAQRESDRVRHLEELRQAQAKARAEREALEAQWAEERKRNQQILKEAADRAQAERAKLESNFEQELARHQAELDQMDGRMQRQREELQAQMAAQHSRHLDDLAQADERAKADHAALEANFKQEAARHRKEIADLETRFLAEREAIERKREEDRKRHQSELQEQALEAESERRAAEASWEAGRARHFEELKQAELRAQTERKSFDARMQALERQRLEDLQEFERRANAERETLEAQRNGERARHEEELRQAEARSNAERQSLESKWEQERLRHQAELARAETQSDAERQSLESEIESERQEHARQLKQFEAESQRRLKSSEERWNVREAALNAEIKEEAAKEAARRQALEQKWKDEEAQLADAIRHAEAQAESKRFALETRWKAEQSRLIEELKKMEAEGQAQRQALEAQWDEDRKRRQQELQQAEARASEERKSLEAELESERARHAEHVHQIELQAQEKIKALDENWKAREAAINLEALEKAKSLSDDWEKERQTLVSDIQLREKAVGELHEELSQAQNAIVAAAAASQKASEELRTQLTTEFEKVLVARGTEEAERRSMLESGWRSEKLRLLEEVSRVEAQFKQAQDEILNLRDLMDKQKKTMEADQTHLRQAWEASASAKTRSIQDDHRQQMQSLQLSWDKDKELFLKELQTRDASLRELAEQLHSAREALSQALTKANIDLDGVKDRLQSEFQEKMKSREAQEAERRRAMDAAWRAERERLLQEMLAKEQELQRAQNIKEEWQGERVRIVEEMMLKERQLAQFQEETSALKAALAKQKEEVEAALQKSWDAERHRLVSELNAREGSLRELTRQLETTRDGLVQAQTAIEANAENLRTKLTLEFQETLKLREAEAAERQQVVEERWKAEKDRLGRTISELESGSDEMRREFDKKIHELHQGFDREKEILIDNLESEYSQKKDMLLAACDGYRKELEARERSVKQQEDQYEQGK